MTLLPAAVRAFTRRGEEEDEEEESGGSFPTLGWPDGVLLFDVETTTDGPQRLLFGNWRYCRWDKRGRLGCQTEGLFFADELKKFDPEGYEALWTYAEKHRDELGTSARPQLGFLTRHHFVKQIFLPAADKARALICGFNLPFDLTRLAVGVGEARGPFYNGFSLPLLTWTDPETGEKREDKYKPRVRIKNIDSKRAFMGLAKPALQPEERKQRRFHRGRFLDLRTLAFALTHRGHSLASACEAFDVEESKGEADQHGTITPAYIDYCRQDVRATQHLLEKLRAEFDRHPVDLDPCRTFSPASLAKGYLEAMGVEKPSEKFDVGPEVLGKAMTAYFGGRAECRIRKQAVPVVYMDFLSMYPTVNCLLGTWELLTAERVVVEEWTEGTQELLETVTLDGCFDPGFWSDLLFFARVRPDEDVLPLRAEYDPHSWSQNIGVNRVTADGGLWYAGPDLVASVILTGRVPEIEEAVRLVPQGTQPGLQPVELGGEIEIDPTEGDFFQAVIEQRKRVQRSDRPATERARLDRFLKVMANSGAYGIFAEVNRLDEPSGALLDVFGREEPYTHATDKPEEPGAFCFPPLAACITAGARLMLALLERCATEEGGTYAFCDTDSMAVVASPDGGVVPCRGGELRTDDGREAIRTLSWSEVEALQERFDQLHPYDRKAVAEPVLEVEEENFVDGKQRPLFCYAISAKRYALIRWLDHGTVELVKPSEHGLGHLLDPTDLDAGGKDWMEEVWRWMIEEEHGWDEAKPAWWDRPAVSRITVSSPHLHRPFEEFNEGKLYADQIKPYNFLLSVQVARLGEPPGVDPQHFQLITSYTPDPTEWLARRWTDKYSGRTYRVTTGCLARGDGAVLRSYGDVLQEYAVHPEHKSAGPTGAPCGLDTEGLLRRRHVRVAYVQHVGKESNQLEAVQAGLVSDWEEVREAYGEEVSEEVWREVVLPTLQKLPRADVARKLNVTKRTVSALWNGHREPHPDTRKWIVLLAKQIWAGEEE